MVNMLEGLTPVGGAESKLDKELAELVSSLMTTDNIELKSEVPNPLNLTRLKLMGVWAKQQDMPAIERTINVFIENYLKHMVSNKRQGRFEVVKAISEFRKQIKSSLMGPKEVVE